MNSKTCFSFRIPTSFVDVIRVSTRALKYRNHEEAKRTEFVHDGAVLESKDCGQGSDLKNPRFIISAFEQATCDWASTHAEFLRDCLQFLGIDSDEVDVGLLLFSNFSEL